MSEPEKIKCAAINTPDGVAEGVSHGEIIKRLCSVEKKYKNIPGSWEQGFVTSLGRFVSREEGAKIALSSGQIKKLRYNSTQLFSEDYRYTDEEVLKYAK